MQAADLRDLDDPTCARRLRPPRDRGVLVEGEVRAPQVVVGEVVAQMAPKSAFVPDDDVVETLAADRADQALDERILPGRAAGDYRIRVKLVLGDSKHHQEFRSDRKDIRVD